MIPEENPEPHRSTIIDDLDTSNNDDSSFIEATQYLEFKIPKKWIDDAASDKRSKKEGIQLGEGLVKKKHVIPERRNSKFSRTFKFSFAIIKAKLKMRKILQRVRKTLANSEYYYVYIKVSLNYQKLSDGTYLRVLVI